MKILTTVRVTTVVATVGCVGIGVTRPLAQSTVPPAAATPAGGETRPGPRPTFEVASIKPNKTADAPVRLTSSAGRYSGIGVTLRQLLADAYGSPQPLTRDRMIGGPPWIDDERFDITATTGGATPRDAMKLMLRSLLADRFKLEAHFENRELPVYLLVRARRDGTLGPELRPSKADCSALAAAARSGVPPPPPASPAAACNIGFGIGQMTAQGGSMAQLITVGLGRAVDRPIIDRTELQGGYDWSLRWNPTAGEISAFSGGPGAESADARSSDSSPSIFTALQEQLGLKLEASKGPVDVLVITRAERPTPD
jgi:uncharacterized protein (TIGR03435 family)